ncbi:MAG TPA: indolepyruvate ferredoxin oxidoreductase, partial [Burkholderiaceae bacterium]
MAERSFAREVQQLKVPAGTEFHGEGILAVTKALLEAGVGYVTGYQGAPISHLMDVLADAQPILNELGVYFEPAASEAAAAAALSASVNYPVRGAATWKSTVGTNVASDALANLASGGVTGGALIIVGEDYGEGSSIMQERTHAFAMKSQIWLLDPRPHLPSIVKAVHDGFALSEATNTPVMLELRIRSCHLHGRFTTRENRRPAYTLKEALEHPRRDLSRIVLPPASFMQEREKVEQRWPAALKFITEHGLNEMIDGDISHIGIVMLGGLTNNVLRALKLLGLADLFGTSRVPLYILNVAYPLVDDEVVRFCRGKKAVLMIEEGQPDYHEQHLHTILRRHGLDTAVHGKDVLPMAGDYTVAVLRDGVRAFIERHHPVAFAKPVAVSLPLRAAKEIAPLLPPRPPGLCVGCPERPIFSSLKLVEQELGAHHVSADIGCHL